MNKVIIFDMDGTLVNSSLTIANAINYVRGKINLPAIDTDLIAKTINDTTISSSKYFYNSKKFTKEHEKWFSEYYTKNHKNELALYDGIYELLINLKENNFKLAVATNAYRKSAVESLTFLKIMNLFDTVVCHDEVEQGKPYPDMLFKVLDNLNLEKENAVFVGDGSRDKTASRKADIDYIMVNWGFSQYDDAVKSINKLQKILMS